MPKETGGYIAIHRSLKKHWIWQDPIKLKWWLDILLEVNHSPQNVRIKFELFECKRGQSVKSLETWAKEWHADKSTVRRFFKLLQKDGMIIIENLKRTTRITVCKYDSYNNSRHEDATNLKRNATATQLQRNPNNKDNKDNKEKEVITVEQKTFSEDQIKKFSGFQEWIKNTAPTVGQLTEPFTIEQYVNLKEKYTSEQISDMVLKMHNYKPLTKNNSSAYLTFLNWAKREWGEQTQSGNPTWQQLISQTQQPKR